MEIGKGQLNMKKGLLLFCNYIIVEQKKTEWILVSIL